MDGYLRGEFERLMSPLDGAMPIHHRGQRRPFPSATIPMEGLPVSWEVVETVLTLAGGSARCPRDGG